MSKRIKLYFIDKKYTGTGCPECSHEKVCGVFREFKEIVERCGPFEIRFYCKDFNKEQK